MVGLVFSKQCGPFWKERTVGLQELTTSSPRSVLIMPILIIMDTISCTLSTETSLTEVIASLRGNLRPSGGRAEKSWEIPANILYCDLRTLATAGLGFGHKAPRFSIFLEQ
jgi:hypothetical protein